MASATSTKEEIYLPHRRLWTVEEFDCAGRMGIFKPEERLELIEGEIISKMSPQLSPHATGINLTNEALRLAFPPGYHVRIQQPLVFGTRSKPEPDIAVVVGAVRDYAGAHPTTAVLVVEVADSSVLLDRTTKVSLYARASIAEYWLLNLPERLLEVYREPAAMAGRPLGHHYRSITRYTENDFVSPLAAPNAGIRVVDFLP